MRALECRDLKVSVGETAILKGLSLRVPAGEVHALMGPNGSGKSSLAFTLSGHPRYTVTGGEMKMDGDDLAALPPDERARRGLFLAFQYPSELPGITVEAFLRAAVEAVRGRSLDVDAFRAEMLAEMERLEMDAHFAARYLNEGFSGGEKKRCENLQMALLRPRYAILDETDSGLDIDALRIVSDGVNRLRGPEFGVLAITHYTRILTYLRPDFVHVMMAGRIVRSGGPELAHDLEEKGYDFIRRELGLESSRAAGGAR